MNIELPKCCVLFYNKIIIIMTIRTMYAVISPHWSSKASYACRESSYPLGTSKEEQDLLLSVSKKRDEQELAISRK